MAGSPYMMIFTFSVLMASRKYIDSGNPDHVFFVRTFYLLSQLVCSLLVGYIFMKAKKNTDPGLVTVKEEIGFGQEGFTSEKINIREYDTRECKKHYYRTFVGLGITFLIHYKWGFVPPLIIQGLVHPISLFNSPLGRVYIRKQRAWGDLKRPWKEPSSALSGKWNTFSETWTSAMNGTPVIKRNKDKKSKRR